MLDEERSECGGKDAEHINIVSENNVELIKTVDTDVSDSVAYKIQQAEKISEIKNMKLLSIEKWSYFHCFYLYYIIEGGTINAIIL